MSVCEPACVVVFLMYLQNFMRLCFQVCTGSFYNVHVSMNWWSVGRKKEAGEKGGEETAGVLTRTTAVTHKNTQKTHTHTHTHKTQTTTELCTWTCSQTQMQVHTRAETHLSTNASFRPCTHTYTHLHSAHVAVHTHTPECSAFSLWLSKYLFTHTSTRTWTYEQLQ